MLYPLFALILHRTLRRGEPCGLRDHDVDLGEACLTVVQQITTVGYTPVVRKVKSDAGDRIIPLGPATVAALTEYLEMRDGGMKEVQEVLGHSTIGLASDTYTSVILELRRPNADTAANLIPRQAQ